MAVSGHPVPTQSSETCSQNEAGQVRDPYPWKDYETGVICHQMEVLLTGGSVPADKLIARSGFPGRGTKKQTGNGAVQAIEGDIFNVFADMPFASEIVVAIHEAMEQIVFGPSSLHDIQLHGLDGAQIGLDRIAPVGDIENSSPPVTAVVSGRQGDKSLLLEFSQHAATGHILEQTVTRAPFP